MPQSADPVLDDERTDQLGVPVFWPKPTSDPPSNWESWIGQFSLAIFLRERCVPRELLKTLEAVREVAGTSEDSLGNWYNWAFHPNKGQISRRISVINKNPRSLSVRNYRTESDGHNLILIVPKGETSKT